MSLLFFLGCQTTAWMSPHLIGGEKGLSCLTVSTAMLVASLRPQKELGAAMAPLGLTGAVSRGHVGLSVF